MAMSEKPDKAKASSRIIARVVIPIVAVTLVCAALIAIVLFPHTSYRLISFDGNGATKGTMDGVEVLEGETVVLPKNEYRRKGFKFDGWTDAASNASYADGDSVVVEGDLNLEARWLPAVRFVANGGVGDTIKLYPDGDGLVVLPECTFAYKDHTFVGWSEQEDAGFLYNAGGTHRVGTDEAATFYAQWQLDGDAVKDQIAMTLKQEGDDDGNYWVALLAQNNSAYTVDIEATFSYQSFDGATLDTSTDACEAIGPGESTLLFGVSETPEIDVADYDIDIKENRDSAGIAGHTSITLDSVSGDTAMASVTNTGSSTVYLMTVLLYVAAQDTWGQCFPSPEDSGLDTEGYTILDPGDRVELTYQYQGIGDHGSDITLFPYGYAERE